MIGGPGLVILRKSKAGISMQKAYGFLVRTRVRFPPAPLLPKRGCVMNLWHTLFFVEVTLHFELHQPQNANILQAKFDIKEHKDTTNNYSIDILSHIKQNHFQSERIKHPIAYKSKELIKQLIKIDYFFFVFRQNVVSLQS